MSKDTLRKGAPFHFSRPMLPPLKARITRLTRDFAVCIYRDDEGVYREVWIPRDELARMKEATE